MGDCLRPTADARDYQIARPFHSQFVKRGLSPNAPISFIPGHQALLVAGFTAYPQKSMFQSAALQVIFEFPLNVVRQCPAFLSQLPPENRVVLRHQLIEERLLGPMALIVKSAGARAGVPCRAI
jgi:hypothetical protein